MENIIITGHIVDIKTCRIIDGNIEIINGKIKRINALKDIPESAPYIMPGFIDSHVHIESSMLLPAEFAKFAVKYGTVGVVTDPHEIANVLGIEGIDFMINNGKTVPFHFYFGAPSCVPATQFETSGATLDSNDIRQLMARDDIHYLSEMMNFPGVLFHDKEVEAKLKAARDSGKPIDGHAPGLTGQHAIEYIKAGISTDHECSSLSEAKERIENGMKVLIREGSAARNFEALIPLITDYPDSIMFCSDDKHPDELVHGHINNLVKRALSIGYPIWNILKAACLNPIIHYHMTNGLLQEGDNADFIIVDNLNNFNIISTYINGQVVYNYKDGWSKEYTVSHSVKSNYPNNFNAAKLEKSDVKVIVKSDMIKVISAFNGELLTKCESCQASIINENGQHVVVPDINRDILKIIVYNRYNKYPPQIAFIKGFGLKSGAMASTIAHDSHNIIAVGTNDDDILTMINALIDLKGGIAVGESNNYKTLSLPIAGLISPLNAEEVADKYHELNMMAHNLGSKLDAPFMTLSFMALLVIPELKLSDKGLFDGNKFEFTSLEN